MTRLTAFTLSVLLFITAAGAQPDARGDKAEREKLRGAWGTVRSTRDGKESPAEKGVKLVFDGDLVIVHEPDRKEPVPMKFNPQKRRPNGEFSAWTFDDPTDPTKPRPRTATALRSTYGIYKVEGDELTLAIQSAFSFPQGFTDEKQVLWVLRREPAKK